MTGVVDVGRRQVHAGADRCEAIIKETKTIHADLMEREDILFYCNYYPYFFLRYVASIFIITITTTITITIILFFSKLYCFYFYYYYYTTITITVTTITIITTTIIYAEWKKYALRNND